MIFIRLLRFIVCMALTIPCWCVAIIFLYIVDARDPVLPNDVYYWLKKAVTNAAISTVAFFKNELF